MKKDFLAMTAKERDVEARKFDRAINFNATRPLSPKGEALWELAKRGRGRPRKPAGEKSQRILITVQPDLLERIEKYSAANGLDRSKLFALSVQAFFAADDAHRQAMAKAPRRA